MLTLWVHTMCLQQPQQLQLIFVFTIRNLKSEIPNITGWTPGDALGTHWLSADENTFTNSYGGCFFNTNVDTRGGYAVYKGSISSNLVMEASRSSNRYGRYTEVNPLYTSTKMCIRYTY